MFQYAPCRYRQSKQYLGTAMADGLPMEGEELLRKIFNYSNDAIFVIDPERDEIIDINPRACSLLGYSREELLSLGVSAIHPWEMPQLLAFARSVFEQGQGWTNELTCLTKTGFNLPAEISASVIEMSGRKCLIAFVRDISVRKQLEEELKQHSANLEALVDERTERLRRSEERQRVLLEINNALIANLDRESLFRTITTALRQVVSFDGAAICLREQEKDVFQLFALETLSLANYKFGIGEEFERESTHVGWVLDHGRSLLRRDLTRERQFPLEDRLLAQGIRSYVVVPLFSRGKVFGTLNVGSRAPDFYSASDVSLLEEIAKQVSLAIENAWAFEEIAQLKARLEQENLYLQEEIKTEHNFEEMIGRSRAIKKVLKAVETVAPTDASVLLLGETGTGKELIARALHNLSPRREKPLVKVNCATLPSGLIENELFGHEKGAFTGALTKKVGRFELSHGGTIFLDEIGELPLDLQAKLLRVLQEGEFERVGSAATIKVDVRVIAATNRDLEKAVQESRFRQDLFYRLNVFPIRIPPLRERREDISLLVKYFAAKHGAKLGKKLETIPEKSMEALSSYPWPGNVRELENVIERSVITSQGSQLDLENWLQQPGATSLDKRVFTLTDVEREHIVNTLKLTGWKVSGNHGAARILGMKPTTLEARMKKLGIKRGTKAPNIS